MRIVPRTEYGLPAIVRGSDGSPRPPLRGERWMTAHYTGNNVDYTDKVTTEVILQIQRIFSKTKPFEYNYVIGQEDNDEIYEFAGKFQAAHSAGENSDSFGVLFLLGVGEPLLDHMIKKWQWLREVLIYDGSLSPSVIQLPHYMMPGAATACPGNQVMNRWSDLLQPYYQPNNDPIGELRKMDPVRIFDSRQWGNPFKPGKHTMQLYHVPQIPASVKSLVLNVTAVSPSGEGFVTLWPTGKQPNISNLNFKPATSPICNTTLVNVFNRQFEIYVSSQTELIFDVLGYHV